MTCIEPNCTQGTVGNALRCPEHRHIQQIKIRRKGRARARALGYDLDALAAQENREIRFMNKSYHRPTQHGLLTDEEQCAINLGVDRRARPVPLAAVRGAEWLFR